MSAEADDVQHYMEVASALGIDDDRDRRTFAETVIDLKESEKETH